MFVVAGQALFLGRAVHIDEAFFLAVARQILRDPLHPLAFDYNWWGWTGPAAPQFVHSALVPYLLAPLVRLSEGREWLLRLLALPVDLAAAAFLYGIAVRFLRRPLLPVLAVLSCPAYFLTMGQLSAEKWVMAFCLGALYGALRGGGAWFWGSACLAGLAVTAKHNAVFVVMPVWFCLRERGVAWPRRAVWLAAALLPAVLDALVLEPGRLPAAMGLVSRAFAWPQRVHHWRALAAFIGGAGLAFSSWTALIHAARRRPGAAAAVLAACVLLFLPVLDLAGRDVSWLDRGLGVLLAWGAAQSALVLWEAKILSGRALWASWLLAAGGLALLLNWVVAGRFVFFLAPPLILALAARAEEGKPKAFWGVAATAALSLGLATVDAAYADSQRAAAAWVRAQAGAGRVWFTGHWGLQHYLEAAGARALDKRRGGWDAVQPGDWVVVPRINTSDFDPPSRPMRSETTVLAAGHRLPLRLISFGGSQAGFYSSSGGFLPFAFSRESLEEYRMARLLPP